MSTNDASDVPPPPLATENAAEQGGSTSFPIVGVGASAGGLEALTELFGAMSPQPGLAFLIAVHLDPHQKSHLPEILGKTTAMPVREVTEGMSVHVNEVYLLPPNTNMALTDGRLELTPRSFTPGGHMPIDHLFRSLAIVRGSQAIGIVLSGGGTDGALGLQAIKSEGGIAFAQDEKTAKHASMPRAAILDGTIDYVLRPSDIACELERLRNHSYARKVEPSPETHTYDGILSLLRARTAVDFSHYKQSTIKRRILRRMALRGIEDIRAYLRFVREDPVELNNLYQDFLIRVTQFFRDPEAFEALKDKVFPALIEGLPPKQPLRIWVAGCSTGEEVYSLLIVLLEYLEAKSEMPSLKVLATDLNESALEKARAGTYLDNIEIDVPPERLRRFFIRQDGNYQISKSVRELCVFSRHNLVSDPPFAHINLVSCRNVLIYMSTALQRRVLPVLHYALNPNGFLFLGSSESIGTFGDLFDTIDVKHRIFVKMPANIGPLEFAPHMPLEGHVLRRGREENGGLWSALDVQREADRLLLARYAPVGVIVDEGMTVLQFRGRTAPYLEPAPGMATLDLFRMLREGLLAEVRAAINQAKIENATIVREGVRLIDGEQTRLVKVEIIPFKVSSANLRFFLALFQDRSSAAAPPPVAAAGAPTESEQQVVQLQQELTALREYLQSVIEEQESTNEELKSANEEILSANEELQSTNEELQTAKEEAQSANEELATVNEELRHRNSELARVNDDLMNLLSGVNIPIVMVGRDLRIRRLTPLAEKMFNLIPTDVGRPISDIKTNIKVVDLNRRIAGVIDTLTAFESEVQTIEGRWYTLRIRPYVTLDNKIDGASIVLLDIDSIKQQLEQL
ncbi:MAG TPA: CheR family methyltransferase, partial [Gemmataceae bacterium]|nr:CheR family methyltransferase [Gemmataceae bacterium]